MGFSTEAPPLAGDEALYRPARGGKPVRCIVHSFTARRCRIIVRIGGAYYMRAVKLERLEKMREGLIACP